MTISELIAALEAFKDAHGDVHVICEGEYGGIVFAGSVTILDGKAMIGE